MAAEGTSKRDDDEDGKATESSAPVATKPEGTKPKPGPEKAPANGARDITAGFVERAGLIQPRDSVLMDVLGGNPELYREILRDEQVKTAIQQRQLAVTSKEWIVEPGGEAPIDKEAADFVRAQLERVGFDRITTKMLFGVFYGFAVAELIYEVTPEGRIGWKAIKVRNRARFGFNAAGELRMLTRTNMVEGESCDPTYFWHFATGADNDDEPHGLGLAHWLYWPVLFKRNGIKFWLVFLEKFGMPTPVGKFPAGTSDEDQTRLLDALSAIHTDSAIVIPNTMEADMLEAARSGTADYDTLCTFMDRAILRAVIGQTASAEGTPGKLGGEELRSEVRDDIVKADADLICESLNLGPLRTLVEWNFLGAKVPRVFRRIDPPEDLDAIANRDKVLHDMGWERTEDSFRETYGEGYEYKEPAPMPLGLVDPNDPNAPPNPMRKKPGAKPGDEDPAFASVADFPDQSTLDAALDELDNGRGFDALNGSLRPVFAYLEKHGAQDTLARFAELYASVDVVDLQDRVARLLFVADLWGRIHARD